MFQIKNIKYFLYLESSVFITVPTFMLEYVPGETKRKITKKVMGWLVNFACYTSRLFLVFVFGFVWVFFFFGGGWG